MSQLATYHLNGQARDLPFHLCPPDVWNAVSGVVFRDGAARPNNISSAVWTSVTQLSPRYLNGYRDVRSGKYWAQAGGVDLGTGEAQIYEFEPVLNGTNIGQITPTAWLTGGPHSTSGQWTGGRLSGFHVFNVYGTLTGAGNGIIPCYSGSTIRTVGAVPTLPLWGANWRTKALRASKYHLISMFKYEGYGATPTEYPDTISWSHAGVGVIPPTWVPAAGNQAGSTELSDSRGGLVDGCVLGEEFLVYKQEAIYLMSYVGGNAIFSFRKFPVTAGALSQNCIVQVGNLHYVFGPEDIFAVDLAGNVKSVIGGSNRRYLYNQMGVAGRDSCFAVHNKVGNEIHFCYPIGSATAPTTSMVLDLGTGRWATRSLENPGGTQMHAGACVNLEKIAATGDVCLSERAVLLGGGSSSNFYQALDQVTYPPSTSHGTSTLIKDGLDLDNPQTNKLVTGVRLRADMTAADTLTVTVQGRQLLDGSDVETSGSMTWTVGTTEQLDCLVSGKYFKVTVTTAAAAGGKLYGFELEYETRGSW